MYLTTTYNAFVLVVAKRTLIANADECCWSYIAVADRAFAITLIAETSNGNSRLFAAHHKIAVGAISLYLTAR